MAEIDTSIDKHFMQKATRNNLFNAETFFLKGETNHLPSPGAFYQAFAAKLIKAVYDTKARTLIAGQLIDIADRALDLQQTETAEQVSQLLTTVPLPPAYQTIGQYYHIFCLKRRGEVEPARAGFQRLAEAADLPLKFRARAIQALGASYRESGQHDDAMRFFIEAGRAASTRHSGDLLTQVRAQLMIAVYQGMSGDHQGALRHMEAVRPLVRLLIPHQPLMVYFYANGLAVELSELGRLEEARRLTEFIVRSPYADLHPEWRETYDEVAAKRRGPKPSLVAGIASKSEAGSVKSEKGTGSGLRPSPFTLHTLRSEATNVVALPLAARPPIATEAVAALQQPARVIAYQGWQRSVPELGDNRQESFTYNDLDQMSIADKQRALLDVIYSDQVTHHMLDQLLIAAGRVKTDASAS
ncbi:MAG TPA: hypothetical protein VKA60_18695 [Blastocatellia bacterium]|nr:hypothetical protein [Blastocatellia bacterium]